MSAKLVRLPSKQPEPYVFKYTIGKVTGDGEQTAVEVVCNPEALVDCVRLAYEVLDTRMFIQNQRYLDSTGMLPEMTPEVANLVKRCIERTHGRKSPELVLAEKEAERAAVEDDRAQTE